MANSLRKQLSLLLSSAFLQKHKPCKQRFIVLFKAQLEGTVTNHFDHSGVALATSDAEGERTQCGVLPASGMRAVCREGTEPWLHRLAACATPAPWVLCSHGLPGSAPQAAAVSQPKEDLMTAFKPITALSPEHFEGWMTPISQIWARQLVVEHSNCYLLIGVYYSTHTLHNLLLILFLLKITFSLYSDNLFIHYLEKFLYCYKRTQGNG